MAALLRILAVTASAIVVLSFALFAADQLSEGSENQVRAVKGDGSRAQSQALLDEPSPPPAVERLRERMHSGAREAIDDGNDILLAPFAGILDAGNVWARRLLPGVLALLAYGLLGMLLANMLPGPKHRVRDWREAPS